MAHTTTPGNVLDHQEAERLLSFVHVKRPCQGRPRKRPAKLLADKGYACRAVWEMLRKKGVPCVIPERDDQKKNRKNKGQKGGRPRRFDADAYKGRNVVERCFRRLKRCRAIATRYQKLDHAYSAFVTLASIRLWLR